MRRKVALYLRDIVTNMADAQDFVRGMSCDHLRQTEKP